MDDCIKLNFSFIKEMLECSNLEENPEVMHIIDTLFHEARHVIQFRSMEKDNMDEEIYEQYKEDIIRNILTGYYKKNYIGVTFEKDARVEGAKQLVELLKKYFPYMEKCIEYYDKLMNDELKEEVTDKKTFELSKKKSMDEIMEKLISINPDIMEEYKQLGLEYNKDGTKKEKEEIVIK